MVYDSVLSPIKMPTLIKYFYKIYEFHINHVPQKGESAVLKEERLHYYTLDPLEDLSEQSIH